MLGVSGVLMSYLGRMGCGLIWGFSGHIGLEVVMARILYFGMVYGVEVRALEEAFLEM